MCGIAGIIAESESLIRETLPRMLTCMSHRGPDDDGIEIIPFGDRFLGLGHRRLAIIDLSPAGHQPMIHPASGDQIIFNGEVYNFEELRKQFQSGEQFRGHSDTEVMLHLLSRDGPAATARFHGMYAFAFLNRRGNRLLLARDPMGIKPLYLAATPRAMVFASEVRSIIASGLVPAKIDPAGLASLLAYGAVQQPATFFRGISSFPPGHLLELTPQSLGRDLPSPTVFWTPPRADRSINESRAIAELQEVTPRAVADHLVADRPVGVFLSSGIDSTIIAGLAAKHTPHLRSFTVGFTDQLDLSEREPATETARLFGLRHTNIDITGTQAEATVTDWLAALDQPSMDGLNVYLISRAVRAEGIVVALSGQGGDELFGGYPSFRDVPRLRQAIRRMAILPPRVRAGAARLLAFRKPLAVREKLGDVFATRGGVLELALLRRRAMSDRQLAALGIDPRSAGLTPAFIPAGAAAMLSEDPADPTWTISLAEAMQYQGNTLLRDSDTNGMAHSLEIRVPLLDQRLVELAMRTPGDVRLPPGSATKHLLRRAFSDLIRPDLMALGKRGFTLPIRRWMIGPLRERCEAAIASLKQVGGLEPRGIDAIWNGFVAEPESPIWSRAWTLVVLGDYVRRTGARA
jgi:asparagine synthase (glutamine-hydrolysing)